MKISMYTMSVEAFIHGLTNVSALLDKGLKYADTKNFDATILANARLAPDMWPLIRQIQIASDSAKGCAARLTGTEPPKFDDDEKTIEELKARIEKTIAYLKSVPAAAFEGAEDRDIKIPLRDRTLEMKGLKYLNKWVLPNFYFHIVTTYALLRHSGVEIGKRDFLGEV